MRQPLDLCNFLLFLWTHRTMRDWIMHSYKHHANKTNAFYTTLGPAAYHALGPFSPFYPLPLPWRWHHEKQMHITHAHTLGPDLPLLSIAIPWMGHQEQMQLLGGEDHRPVTTLAWADGQGWGWIGYGLGFGIVHVVKMDKEETSPAVEIPSHHSVFIFFPIPIPRR